MSSPSATTPKKPQTDSSYELSDDALIESVRASARSFSGSPVVTASLTTSSSDAPSPRSATSTGNVSDVLDYVLAAGAEADLESPLTASYDRAFSPLFNVPPDRKSSMDELQRPMSDDEYEVPKEYQRHSRGTSLPGYSERVSPIKPMAASSSMIRSISPRPLGTIDDMRSDEARIADLERQLAIELKIRAGAESLCRHYAGKKSVDKKSMADALSTLSRTSRRVEVLSSELDQLRGTAPEGRVNQHSRIGTGQSISFQDAGDDESSLSVENVTARILRIREKLDIEQNVKAGAERLAKAVGRTQAPMTRTPSRMSLVASSSTTPVEDRKTSMYEIFKSLSSATAKVLILQQALLKYERLLRASGVDPETIAVTPTTPGTGVSLTGKLVVKVMAAHGVSKNDRQLDAHVVCKVDSVARGKTKTKARAHAPTWNESFTLRLDKANVIEFEFYENNELRCLSFFRLDECLQEFNLSGQITAWFVLEPYGRLQLQLSFTRETRVGRRLSKMNRRGAVRKMKVQSIRGHRFKPARFYKILKCTVCDNIVLSNGLKCIDCSCACHHGCAAQIAFKCAAVAQNPSFEAGSESPNGRAHALDTVFVARPTFCAHCGGMLPIGRRRAQQCSACHINVHPKCAGFLTVPCKSHDSDAGASSPPMSPPPAPHRHGSFSLLNLIRKGDKDEKEKPVSSQPPTPRTEERAPPVAAIGSPREPKPTAQFATRQKMQALMKTNRMDEQDVRLEDFTILKTLGRGNFGKVMLVEHKASGALYAMKVLKKEFILANDELPSVWSEKLAFMVTSSLTHPFLLKLYASFQTETRLYFIMEYVPGGDLMIHIQRMPFSFERALYYAVEVLLALEHLHANDIIYRDLKLDNVLLSRDGHVRLADFGLCKAVDGPGGLTNTFCGTPEFMAPEILRDEDYGLCVDWWAYGVLLYEMFLAESPFHGDDEEDIFDSILEDEIIYPDSLPPALVALLKRLLVKDPTKRLGYRGDAMEIRRHPFFRDVDWDAHLQLKVAPPYTPYLTSGMDVTNFDISFTCENPILTPLENTLSDLDQREFENFSYVSPWQE